MSQRSDLSCPQMAARFGRVECAKLLLDGSDEQKANLEVPEKNHGWTLLLMAWAEGHFAIVSLLIKGNSALFMLSDWCRQVPHRPVRCLVHFHLHLHQPQVIAFRL